MRFEDFRRHFVVRRYCAVYSEDERAPAPQAAMLAAVGLLRARSARSIRTLDSPCPTMIRPAALIGVRSSRISALLTEMDWLV